MYRRAGTVLGDHADTVRGAGFDGSGGPAVVSCIEHGFERWRRCAGWRGDD